MKLQHYLDISTAPDIDSLESRLVGFANHIGFGIISGSLILDRPGAASEYIPIGFTPDAFIEAHRSIPAGLRDPVLKRMSSLTVPFAYDQKVYVDEGAADLWDLQAQFGYKSGIAVATHMGGGKRFILGVDREEALPKNDEVLGRMMADLQLLAAHTQEAASRLLQPSIVAAPVLPPKLTPAECLVLRWTREGKSAGVTAQILGVSVHTVAFHLRNAREKLGVQSKHQAVAKAVFFGLI